MYFTDRLSFNLEIAKSLALKLPHEQERSTAFHWLTKLSDSDNNERNSFLVKQLILLLQRNILAGPFINPPDKNVNLDDLKQKLRCKSISELIAEDECRLYGSQPYVTEQSGDLKEYVAYQEIPKFGQQFYYACSTVPVYEWNNVDKAIFPKQYSSDNAIKIPRDLEKTLKDTIKNGGNRDLLIDDIIPSDNNYDIINTKDFGRGLAHLEGHYFGDYLPEKEKEEENISEKARLRNVQALSSTPVPAPFYLDRTIMNEYIDSARSRLQPLYPGSKLLVIPVDEKRDFDHKGRELLPEYRPEYRVRCVNGFITFLNY